MADVITIDTKGFTKGIKQWEALMKRFPDRVDDVMNKNALQVVKAAKLKAPKNNGQLWQMISADVTKPLVKSVAVNVPYAAYVEFGTGKYAAQYVSGLPAEYKLYASQFKGKSGRGDYYDFLNAILDWVKKKGFARIKNSYTGRSSTKRDDLIMVAEAVAWAILKNGIHPHPFLIPAVIDQKPIIIKDMQTMLNKLGQT